MTVRFWRRVSAAWVARAAGILVGLAGLAVLLGWSLDIAPLTQLWPGHPAIKANTALAFLFCGASLFLSCAGPPDSPRALVAARPLAAAAAALGAISLAEHLAGRDLGIDQLFAHDPVGIVAGGSPGRMSPIAAINFVLLGCSLLLLDVRAPAARMVAPLLVVPAALLALLALIGHLHGTLFFLGISRHTAMRFPVTLQFLAMAVGLVYARPARLPILLASDSAGGILARRLLFIAIVVPPALGWAANAGRHAGHYDGDFAAALIVSGCVFTLAFAIALIAWRLHGADEERLRSRVRELATQQALEQRDEFLMVAAHELYSPISSLQLMVQALERGMAASPAEADRCVKNVSRQAGRLTMLVEQLLDVSRVALGQLHLKLETVDLVDVTRHMVDRFALPLQRARCALTLDAPRSVPGWWDRVRLEQIIGGLLSNAVKFGAGRPIEIVLEQEAATARLVVRDEGLGIPPDRVDRIFDRFERAVSVRQYGGLGCGLYLVHAMAQALGGTVEVQSTLGRGSTFRVTLPSSGPQLATRQALLSRGAQA